MIYLKKLFRVDVGTEDNQSETTEGLLFIDGVVSYYDENEDLMEEWEVLEYLKEFHFENEIPDLVDNTAFHNENELIASVVRRLRLANSDCVNVV